MPAEADLTVESLTDAPQTGDMQQIASVESGQTREQANVSHAAGLEWGPADEIIMTTPLPSSIQSSRLAQLQKAHTMRHDAGNRLTLKQRLWMVLDEPSYSKAAFLYAQVSLLAILISTVSFCLETEFNCEMIDKHPQLSEVNCNSYETTWWWFECLAVAFFTAELVLRFVTCPDKRVFVRGAANWIDLLAILPFYLEIFASEALSAFSVFRVIRLVRVFRVFKMGKSFSGLQLMVSALKESQQVFLILAFLSVIGMIVFASAIHYLEVDGDGVGIGPDGTPASFSSIPLAFWWAIVTMTTLGYGDFYPSTDPGKVLTVVTMFSGIIILAMPITVIGNNFAFAYERQTFEEKVVEDCSRTVPSSDGGKDDHVVDLEKLLATLEDLELRGNLRIAKPASVAELTRLLSEYDGGGDGVKKMSMREWRVFLQDMVIDANDFTSATVEKLARDVHNIHAEARQVRRQILCARDDLRSAVRARAAKARYPTRSTDASFRKTSPSR